MIKDIPFQIDVANRILKEFDKGKKNVLLIAPTGCGKSGIAYQIHKQSGLDICVLSHLKTLQDQYDSLFRSVNDALCIKGQSNYECVRYQNLSVDRAPCKFKVPCDLRMRCEYFNLRKELKSAGIGILNYQFLFSILTMAPSSFDFGKPIYVYDECHSIEDIFTDHCKIEIEEKFVEILEKLKTKCISWYVKDIYDHIDNCIFELSDIFAKRSSSINEFSKYFGSLGNVERILSSFIKENVQNLAKKKDIQFFSSIENRIQMDCGKFLNLSSMKNNSQNVIIDYDDSDLSNSRCELIPIDVSSIFRETISGTSKNNVFMSATILGGKKFLKNLGLEDEPYSIIELDSFFPVEHREINYIPVAKVNSKTSPEEFKTLMKTLTSISNFHIENKESGSIFTPSYELSKTISRYISENFKGNYNLLMNLNSQERESVLENFREAKRINLLISPSFYEGVNFEDDISRFQIIPKVPFKSLGSKYVKEKMKFDQEWYELSALLLVIQACGRSIRHEKDFCETYILDSNFGRLLKKYELKGYIPKWFLEAIRTK